MSQPTNRLEWTTVQRKVNDLVPAEVNPRKISEAKLAKLIEALTKFNVVGIPAIDHDGTLLNWHQRLKAMQAMGRGEEMIDVRMPNRPLTDKERKEYILLDNQHYGEWDEELLPEFMEDLDMGGLGFEMQDFMSFDTRLAEEEEKQKKPERKLEAKDDDFVPPAEVFTDIVLGDLFEFRKEELLHRLLCGDSTIIDTRSKLMDGQMADLNISDPPYNVDYEGGNDNKLKILNDKQEDAQFYQFLYDFYTASFAYMNPGAAFYVWHAETESVNFRKAFKDAGFLFKQVLIWVKNQLVLGRQDYQWKHEPCIYGWKPGGAHYFTDSRSKTTVIEDQPIDYNKLKKEERLKLVETLTSEKRATSVLRHRKPLANEDHPTMKPVLLIAELIKNSSNPDDIVIDGFQGSGTTMVAAHQLERNCYGMELDPKYCQVIVDRMRKLDPALEITRNGQPI
jgi:DNA modification methylase